ncbi:hypothetical protein BB561_004018 [Smittium simulii]|uniref:Vacuolar ATPase assembly protein VMA22 n=1 Tax=Smittium simulii TaxID=133385 RepID=A0A2T9YIL1_9FUNG|nr:hypothetical protein BB561_004018 [Smittium simulii]
MEQCKETSSICEKYDLELSEYLALVEKYIEQQVELQKLFMGGFCELSLARIIKGHYTISPDQYDYRTKAIAKIEVQSGEHFEALCSKNLCNDIKELGIKDNLDNQVINTSGLRRRNNPKKAKSNKKNLEISHNGKDRLDPKISSSKTFELETNKTTILPIETSINRESATDKTKNTPTKYKQNIKCYNTFTLNILEKSNEKDKFGEPLKDPLYWFGMLPPAQLYNSKQLFITCLDKIVEISNTLFQLNSKYLKLKNLGLQLE